MSFSFGYTAHDLPREAELANVLRRVGFKVNRARLTIRPSVELSALDIEERAALDALKNGYHFLVLPMEERSDG